MKSKCLTVSMRLIFISLLLVTFLGDLQLCAREYSLTEAQGNMNKLIDKLKDEGVTDERILHVFRTLPRHYFVPEKLWLQAYENRPLSIGYGQTISQPFIVGFMTQALDVQEGQTILEIGTGSGYQAAFLGELNKTGKIYTIDIVEPLAKRAADLLIRLGYNNIFVKSGDGYKGWSEQAPFDRIILTAAPLEIPKVLLNQLKIGGILVAPVGEQQEKQDLMRIRRLSEEEFDQEKLLDVRFVPMVKEAKGKER